MLLRFIILSLIIMCFSCSSKTNNESIIFDHRLFSIEYPKTWELVEEEGIILAIKKYNKVKAAIDGQNPNLVAVAQDSIELAKYGILDLESYVEGFKQSQKGKENWTLQNDTELLKINENEVLFQSFKIKSPSITQLQKQYFFCNLGQYIGIMLTQPNDMSDEDLSSIIQTLRIPHYDKLDISAE